MRLYLSMSAEMDLLTVISAGRHLSQTLHEDDMDKLEFRKARRKLDKTQKQLAELLGTSIRTVHSYEQGLRKIPTHIERQIYFLHINQRGRNDSLTTCWEKKHCTVKEQCPAFEFQSGHLCWFLCGTLCGNCSENSRYQDKLDTCRSCEVFNSLID